MQPVVCCLLIAAIPTMAFGQFSDNFDDGDFTQHPSWQGMDTSFLVTGGMLRSRHTVPNSTFYLSSPVTLSGALEWEWRVHLDLATSSVNYADVYLLAPDESLSAGYFVRIGNTADEVSLYRQPPGSPAVKLIDGRDGVTIAPLKIRVTRTDAGEWRLFTNNVPEGMATDETSPSGEHFGIKVRQSTASFFNRHYFDDIFIRPLETDTTPPEIILVTALSAGEILIRFSEPVDSLSACNTGNYLPEVQHITWEADAVRIILREPLQNGVSTTLFITDITDMNSNTMKPAEADVLHYTPGRYDVLIHEIMADPTPSAGLPEYEYAELRNVTPFAINLKGWVLRTGTAGTTLPDYILQPDSLVVVSGRTAFPFFYPAIDAGTFPALPNDGATLSLYDPQATLIHAVAYSKSWYEGSIKDAGGWSLEMKDIRWPCAGAENWKASADVTGGTPGRDNTAAGPISAPLLPSLVRISVPDSMRLQLHFSGGLDSLSACNPACYDLPEIDSISAAPPLFDVVSLRLKTAVRPGALNVRDVKDCAGRTLPLQGPVSFARPVKPDSLDLVINEILFDPPQGAADFVEIFNRSNKAIELDKLYFASRDADGLLKQAVPLVSSPFLCLPGDYIAYTAEMALCRYYICGAAQGISSLPTLPPDEGNIVLLRSDGQVIDELHYTKSWHHGILQQTRGVSLERLHFDQPTGDPHNWHSAAATAGYGTPGMANSQFRPASPLNSGFVLSNEVFSPDNDGNNDVALLAWDLRQGQTANITMFDAQGRPVRHLARNLLLSVNGRISWDGISDTGGKALPGIYVIFVQVFDQNGQVGAWKLPLVLAGN